MLQNYNNAFRVEHKVTGSFELSRILEKTISERVYNSIIRSTCLVYSINLVIFSYYT